MRLVCLPLYARCSTLTLTRSRIRASCYRRRDVTTVRKRCAAIVRAAILRGQPNTAVIVVNGVHPAPLPVDVPRVVNNAVDVLHAVRYSWQRCHGIRIPRQQLQNLRCRQTIWAWQRMNACVGDEPITQRDTAVFFVLSGVDLIYSGSLFYACEAAN